MKNIVIKKPIAFIDVESTGFNPVTDRIVELTILKLLPDGTEELWSKRINPEIPIPISASEIHGITEKDITNEPTFRYYAKYLSNYLGDCDLGGYGIIKFDLPIIEAEFKRAGIEFSRKGRDLIDALVIFHQLEPRDLGAAYKKYCGKVVNGISNVHKKYN